MIFYIYHFYIYILENANVFPFKRVESRPCLTSQKFITQRLQFKSENNYYQVYLQMHNTDFIVHHFTGNSPKKSSIYIHLLSYVVFNIYFLIINKLF